LKRLIARLVTVEEGEWRATLLAFVFFFFVLASYFILRSIRDAVGVAAGTAKLPWLFTGTLIATLAVNPLFGRIVSKLPVRRFIPIVYRIFAVLLLGFAAALTWFSPQYDWLLSPAFWIWTSVFSLFVPSVFWGFMADTFYANQGKRLYGFIGVGGTLGALAGSSFTASLATTVGTPVLMLTSIVLLEMAVQVVQRFPPSFRTETREREAGIYEVVVTTTVTAKVKDDKTAFLIEVAQAGIFQIRNISGQELDAVLGITCANILFPYLRESVSSVAVRGGFPPFFLNHLNFEALYQQRLQQEAAAAAAPQA